MSLNLKNKKEKGFTLIEVLIAISILTVGILAMASMQISAIRGNYLSSNLTEATTWAQDKIEYLMSLPYDDADLQDTDGDGTIPPNYGLDHIATSADYPPETHGLYNLYWNVAPDWPVNNTKTIRVIVTWVDKATKSVSLDYIKAHTI